MWEYLLASGTWSIGGLLVGYSLGRTERELTWLRRHILEQEQRDA